MNIKLGVECTWEDFSVDESARSTGEGDLVRVTMTKSHDVSQEERTCVMAGKALTEQPEFIQGGGRGAEEGGKDGGWDHVGLGDALEEVNPQVQHFYISLPQLNTQPSQFGLEGVTVEEEGAIGWDTLSPTMSLINLLQTDLVQVILNQADMGRDSHNCRDSEIKATLPSIG